MKLQDAITLLEAMFNDTVQMIEYEDGSHYKFNYRMGDMNQPKYINLRPFAQ